MSHRNRTMLVAVAVIGVLGAPRPGSAQDTPSDWSRIWKSPSRCRPEFPCPGKVGLIWDSTNAVPIYPPAMRVVGVGGDVVLTFGVREDGRVDSSAVAVVHASNQAFIPSALAAVRGWRFRVEAADRPSGLLPVEVHLIYAHEGVCDGLQRPQHTGWAASNQLVIGVCVVRIPRSQLQRQR